MKTIYGIDMDNSAIEKNLNRLINQIYKLLPSRQQGLEWLKPLDTIVEQFVGMSSLLPDTKPTLLSLVCKLEGLKSLTSQNDFPTFRRIIFESLGLAGELRTNVQSKQS